ncbi:peptidoglycan-binding domain-containing protein [Streptomyces sp. NRRL F-5123]|uniref:peptidoglycan-binding domain-containing protein n=1 Tax=Streptomyces sp. NRRL F-5123 TaxID=1463856 RepID=UPI0006950AA0|nr:peptidoglycan-binding domain-containing protein [Streptomyces sp. NRRL F-5123]
MTGTLTDLGGEPEAEPAPGRRRGWRRRRTALAGAAVLVVAAVAVAGALGFGGGGHESPKVPPRAGSVVAVKRTTLAERVTVDGQLGYGTEVPLPLKATGTVTWLPQQGATVGRGGTLLRVDDRPVVLMYGALPTYRDLGLPGAGGGRTDGERSKASDGTSSGTPTDGPAAADAPAPPSASGSGGSGRQGGELTGMDVLQFERNLAALGYTGFTVDERFTAATAQAVERWQKSLGLPQTGTVGIGDVIYASGRVRIGHADVRLGDAAGENTLTCTDTSRKVMVNASAADAGWARRGAGVRITLPSGTSVQGTVVSVGKQASAPEGGGGGGTADAGASVPVTISVKDQKALGSSEGGPVTVGYVGREARNVLSVPVSALVALAEGGYGLETEDGRFVAVKTGLFADGDVEVSGTAVREGMKVRIPE